MNKNFLKFAGLIIVIAIIFIIARATGLGEKIGELKGWIKSLGPAGPFAYTLLYILAVVLAIPGSVITILAGALFGTVIGTIVVSIGSTAGAALAFLIARYFARDFIREKFGQNEKFIELDRLTAEHGGIIVAITRLVPLFPFNLLNYGFGMTGVRFWQYVFWSWLCMLPFTIVYVAGTDVIVGGMKDGKIPWVPLITLAAALVIVFIAIKKASSRLKKNR